MSSQERALRVAQQQIGNQRMVKAMINSELTTLRAENERLQAAIDKVLALPLMNHKTECKHCGHFTDTFTADTEAIRVALTQGGEG